MTQIKAEFILASKNAATGDVLFTWRLTLPRCILSEINTHRVASRNTSSSRAVPAKVMRKAVLSDPFVPVFIGRNKKGMQAGEELVGWRRWAAERVLSWSRYPAVAANWLLDKLKVHKQASGRLLEPWLWCTQVFSATELDGFFKQRNHSDAEPHFHQLAAQMQHQVETAKRVFQKMETDHNFLLRMQSSNLYQILQPGQWHLPFLTRVEKDTFSVEDKKVASAARAARTSYTLVGSGRVTTLDEDRARCNDLFGADPKHLSPAEHQAMAIGVSEFCANFRGFRQFRKEVE